tara:strand:+ start:160 stop:651 length:492 start_codon:yes stop_codon:yes gene_type:complete
MPFATKLEKQEYLDKKEDRKERRRISKQKYYQNNKEKIKEGRKQYRKDNKEMINANNKKHYQNTKDIYKLNAKIWKKKNPEKSKKSNTISNWKSYNIICDDYHFVYDIYINATTCDLCSNKFKNSKDRNLDHDHDLINLNNIRGIICTVCNLQDKLKGFPPIF